MSEMQFRQKNLSTLVAIAFHEQHLEYAITGPRKKTGFNIRYDALPGEFDYGTFRSRDMMVIGPIYIGALGTLFCLFTDPEINVLVLPPLAAFVAFLALCGYGLRRLLKKDYTALPVGAGRHVLLVKDRHHDAILAEISARRLGSLRMLAVIDPALSPRQELKKLRWLKDNGVLSEPEYAAFERQLLAAISETPSKPTALSANMLH